MTFELIKLPNKVTNYFQHADTDKHRSTISEIFVTRVEVVTYRATSSRELLMQELSSLTPPSNDRPRQGRRIRGGIRLASGSMLIGSAAGTIFLKRRLTPPEDEDRYSRVLPTGEIELS
ncbi:predicted protein [Histoplasma capsulatum G186AR]|uniref:Uncharacterized protein n=1 Tax=Ajellomyces capsulatus (strain G186AR / H82 / ATCC MYA-2454 / RMSCC 2432) TaxID=447093 RepID=C0NQA7_AJECG|nr:uncharacterized protein HCBG_05695 [Histoplasma capsulatum G186AR]EEH06378.1 predicted protein [Histoplasma capsulatum G186AR]